jgi:hypothetical protein
MATITIPNVSDDALRIAEEANDLIKVLHEGRRAIGEHIVPDHCYATGPLTGDEFRDIVQCPACSFIAMYDTIMKTCVI